MAAAEPSSPGRTRSGSRRAIVPSRTSESRNGFLALEELEPIRVSRDNVPPWSIPKEALLHEPAEDQVFQSVEGAKHERRIHANIELRPEEQKNLRKVQDEARERDLAFLPSVSVQATRWLVHADNKRGTGEWTPRATDEVLKGMQRTNDWRVEYFGKGPIKDTQVAEDLRHGVLYFCGRDSSLRPALVFRAARIPPAWLKDADFARLVRVLAFCMEFFYGFMAVPGRTENISLLVDVKGLSFATALLKALQVVGRAMAKYYIGCMFKIRIVNMSTSLHVLARMARRMLSERTKQKLIFVENLSDLHSDFALHQLEEDLGGTLPVHQEFFPFPLQPGPFEAGHPGGPDPSATPGLHAALSQEGLRGRLWDPEASREENTRLVYTAEAPELLSRCGMEVPDAALLPTAGSPGGDHDSSCGSVSSLASNCGSEPGTPGHAEDSMTPLKILAAMAAECSDEEREVSEIVAISSRRQLALDGTRSGAQAWSGWGPFACCGHSTVTS